MIFIYFNKGGFVMVDYIKKIVRTSIFISILLLVLSVFMVTRPMGTVNILLMFFGYILVVDGILHFISYFSMKDEYRFFSFELAQAIVYIIAGFTIVCNVNVVTQSLAIIVGVWIVFESIIKLQIAVNIKDYRGVNWGIMLFMSILSAILGVVLILKPFASTEILIRFTGAILTISQLIEIYDDIYVLNQVGKAEKIIEEETK
jgi:hypothetical protein